ncbi:uncharacterized protein LOC115764315 [Drosophila novamexicana]|uniref:uncharacterized protein LOC115764315 n=1 Tax=Drosophila novamexicana TaxID=47314 RepID=UPI0011E5FB65|nr:uncharacterized protein LOC115764315 [Drosophila novamexicana]
MVSSQSATANRVFWLAILFISLLLPLDTQEASRDLCKGSDDAAACAQATEALGTGRKAAPKRAKFKFHKIQRMDDDDDNGDTGDDNESGAEDMADDNDNDDDENDNDTDNDNDESKAGNRRRQAEDRSSIENYNDNETDDEDKTEPSLLNRIWNRFVWGEAAANETETAETQYPNVLNWLHWLTEPTEEAAPVGKKEKSRKSVKSDIDWLTYLKRWPFNSIFPEPPAQPSAKRRRERHRNSPDDGESSGPSRPQPPKSEEYVELLIHSLPAFIGSVSQAKSGDCHQQLELLHRQLRAHKMWTLQMLDATAKIGAGLLRGNINQFGDYDQCTKVSTTVQTTASKSPMRVHGKYCLAQIEMRSTLSSLKEPLHLLHGRDLWHAHLKHPKHFAPRYNIANWGICLPHACSAHVVHSIIETSLRPYNDTGIEFHIEVRDEHCTTRQRKSFTKLLAKDSYLATGILGIATLGLMCLLALGWEHWDWISHKLMRLHGGNEADAQLAAAEANRVENVCEPQPAEEPELDETAAKKEEEITPALHVRLLGAFSPQRTLESLVSLTHPDVEFPLIHLLKILGTLMIYVNLKYIMAGHLPLTNRDAFVGTVNRNWSLACRIPLLYSDMLLLIGGFLVAHQLSNDMEQTCRLSFLRNVGSKACRHMPSILAVIGFQTWILPHLGSGPLWHLLVGENARLCEENMWRNALSVQNTGDLEEMCSPITVQLSLDLQLYFLGALVVWLYFTDPEAGFFLCGAFHAISVAARFSRTQRDFLAPSLFHGIGVSKFYRTANLIYNSPITRATTYLLGIGAGLLFRSESGSFGVVPRFRRAGWALAMLGIAWCFWSAAAGMRTKFVYNATEAAAYLAWSPLILGLGLCWAILMAPLDKGLVQRYPNIARPVLLLSRMQIPLQLASYVVVLWSTASVKEPHQFQISDLISLQELACIVCFALVVAFLIDFPAQQIGYILLDIIFSDVLLSSSKVSTTVEPSEATPSEKSPDSPEPIESIWSSESEPEEEKSNDI